MLPWHGAVLAALAASQSRHAPGARARGARGAREVGRRGMVAENTELATEVSEAKSSEASGSDAGQIVQVESD